MLRWLSGHKQSDPPSKTDLTLRLLLGNWQGGAQG